MDQVVEQVCCRRRNGCITDLEAFETIAIDISVLSVAILNRCEITADDPEYTPRSYRKAAYRQLIVWQNGYWDQEIASICQLPNLLCKNTFRDTEQE